MNFDMNKTLALLVGGLTKPAETWESYLGENRPWQYTLVNLTAPLVVANVLLSLVLSRWFGTFSAYNVGGNGFVALIQALFLAAIGFAIAVLVINFLAGVFQGKPEFSRAFAAVSLVAIPAWVAGVVGAAIPWIGTLVSLAGAIVSLVFLYRILPLALNIPDGKRVVHLVASIIGIIIINIIVGTVLRVGGIISPPPSSLIMEDRGMAAISSSSNSPQPPPAVASVVGAPGPTGQPSISQATNISDQPIRKVIEYGNISDTSVPMPAFET